MRRQFYIHTFGCQMNVHDSEKISGVLVSMGFEKTESEKDADIIILNTCAVREKPVHKVYSELGRLKKHKRRGAIIGVCGCVAQKEGKNMIQRAPFVDFVIGPRNIYKLPEAVENAINNKKSIFTDLTERCAVTDLNFPLIRENRYRAYVTIMEGCNNFCTYCIVPFVRGREISRPSSDIIDEIKALADQGYKEVTLLGQNVNSYGRRLHENIDFADLLYKIHDIEGIEWIRFITSHPKDFSDKLIEAITSLPKVCEYIHLPAQSGSNKILKLMNRRYTKEKYIEIVEKIKSSGKYFAFTSDFIVGFPQEEEEDFLETIDLVKKVRYEGIFAFVYNPREFTIASKWEDNVPQSIKKERLNRLLKVQNIITEELSKAYEGNVYDVLFDQKEGDFLIGRTRTFKIVKARGDKKFLGNIVKVRITKAKMYELEGEIVEEEK